MLTAGLDGIERGLDAGEPKSPNLYELTASDREAQGIDVLPGNLLDATRELAQNDALRVRLGRAPGGG
jgi:glutamine synthetase